MPFAPLGAKWGGRIDCTPTWASCGPESYPYDYTFEVTEDTVIQGKYCTLTNDGWDIGFSTTIVHQDGHKIYRYDREEEVFKLVLDFSKEVGESWQVELPQSFLYGESLTITVLEREGPMRKVSLISSYGSWGLAELPLYEGFGGVEYNYRLLIGFMFFIHTDPIFSDDLICYIDPQEGLLYGSASGCDQNTSTTQWPSETALTIYPNPASTQITLQWDGRLGQYAEWHLIDPIGRLAKRQILPGNGRQQSIQVDHLPRGLYFWRLWSKGQLMRTGKLVLAD